MMSTNMRFAEIKIGVFTVDKVLVGYKLDTFWHLGKDGAKRHCLDANGQIPEHMISNLSKLLANKAEEPRSWLAVGLGVLCEVAKDDFLRALGDGHYYVGYEYGDDKTVVLTHSIHDGGLTSITVAGV